MSTVIVRYRVKEGRGDDNVGLVRAVFAQLERERPPGLAYQTYRAEDGVSFTHIATITTPDGANPLAALSAFQAFSQTIRDRCDEPPVVTQVATVGAYAARPE